MEGIRALVRSVSLEHDVTRVKQCAYASLIWLQLAVKVASVFAATTDGHEKSSKQKVDAEAERSSRTSQLSISQLPACYGMRTYKHLNPMCPLALVLQACLCMLAYTAVCLVRLDSTLIVH